jgi:hypothetical protein
MINYLVIHLEDRVPRSYPPEFRRRVLALVEAAAPLPRSQPIWALARSYVILKERISALTWANTLWRR